MREIRLEVHIIAGICTGMQVTMRMLYAKTILRSAVEAQMVVWSCTFLPFCQPIKKNLRNLAPLLGAILPIRVERAIHSVSFLHVCIRLQEFVEIDPIGVVMRHAETERAFVVPEKRAKCGLMCWQVRCEVRRG